MAILPHRYPFLLIDRVLESQPQKAHRGHQERDHQRARSFQGHFPDYAIMPGVLMVEAIAQAGGVLLLPEVPDHDTKLMVFSGIDRARFRRPVVPGDQLRIEVDVLNWKPRAARLEGKVFVDRKLVCEATIMCQVVPRPARVVFQEPEGTPPATLASDANAEAAADPEAAPALETVSHE